MKNQKNKKSPTISNNKTRVSQSDIPAYNLDKALTLAQAIMDNYAGKSATPLQVGKALGVQPTTGPFRMLCGASIAYGLTEGGYNADQIVLTPLAKKILKPIQEDEDKTARIEAFLKPRIMNEFFNKYHNAAIPREDIAKNVLEGLGVPKDRLDAVYDVILTQGQSLGIIFDLNSKKYVDIKNVSETQEIEPLTNHTDKIEIKDENENTITQDNLKPKVLNEIRLDSGNIQNSERLKKVFITHGKNTKFIEPIKKLLSFGELTAVVSVEKTTISQPVPDKVMNDMRSCGAAIIHVEEELKLIDDKAVEHKIINSNVLIEIGAAMALFGRRFILLVKEGINLPSNLQGLFEVRYSGDTLDGNATIKLMEAINDIKNQQLPNS